MRHAAAELRRESVEDQLAARFARSAVRRGVEPALEPEVLPRVGVRLDLARALLRELARGEPVGDQPLADTAQRSPAEVARVLSGLVLSLRDAFALGQMATADLRDT
jgi:hypothetical protein